MKKVFIFIIIVIIVGLVVKFVIKHNTANETKPLLLFKPEMEKVDWLQGMAVFSYKGKKLLFDFNSGSRDLDGGYMIITNKEGDRLTLTKNGKIVERWAR